MNVVCFVLVVVAFLIHPVDSVSIVEAANKLVSSPLTEGKDATSASTRRFLRVETFETNGERGFNLEKVKTLLVPVSQAKLDKWAKAGKPLKDVFTRLDLATSPSWLLFDNPHFILWVKYVDDFNALHPDKAVSVIPTLTTRYGDETLMKMIATATRNPRTENLATRLNAEQMQHWAKTGKSPSDVYTLFNLDKVKKGILSNPQFSAWTKYVDDFNANHPDKPTTVIPTLTTHYGDDVLFDMLVKAKNVEETKSIATKLQTEQLQAWLSAGKSPDNAFVQMGLSQTYYILEKPLLNDWVKYLNAFNAKYPEKKSSMIETFTRRFGDEKLTTMLLAAKEEPATKLMAADLQTAQINHWLSRGDTADDVFTLLKLDKLDEKLFDSPLLSTWTAYLEAFNKANPDKKTSLFKTLLSHYRDGALFKIVDEAARVPGMEQLATKWQAEKMQGWLADKKPPKEVLILVGLSNPREDLLSTSLFNTWLNYVKAFNKANPTEKVNFYDNLHAQYMDNWMELMVAKAMTNPRTMEIAKVVQAERLKRMLNSHHFPDDLFAALKLSKEDNFLASRDFKLWTKYLSDFNQRYPKYKMTMIDALMKANRDYSLTKMLIAAKKNPSTERQATSLLRSLMNKWVGAKKDPAKVSEMFRILQVGADGTSLLKTYVSKYNRAWGSTT